MAGVLCSSTIVLMEGLSASAELARLDLVVMAFSVTTDLAWLSECADWAFIIFLLAWSKSCSHADTAPQGWKSDHQLHDADFGHADPQGWKLDTRLHAADSVPPGWKFSESSLHE